MTDINLIYHQKKIEFQVLIYRLIADTALKTTVGIRPRQKGETGTERRQYWRNMNKDISGKQIYNILRQKYCYRYG